MIIYVHGFGSSGQGGKARAFRDYFGRIGEPFIAPSLSYIPELAIRTLEELIGACGRDIGLIGSSLGGFYSLHLAHKYDLPAVLINPAVTPHRSLQRALGMAPSYFDDSRFEWTPKHLESLETFQVEKPGGRLMLLLQKGDELLDYRDALARLPEAATVVEAGGSHAFDQIERHYEAIRTFLTAQSRGTG